MESSRSYEIKQQKNSLRGKISKLQVLLTSSKDPNNITHLIIRCKNSTKLHYTSDYKMAKELLESGADVNKKNSWGETPLHIALLADKGFRFVKLLLEHGADANAISGLGRTPLHCIFKRGKYADKKIINMLLLYGADIDVNSYAFFSTSGLQLTGTNERWYDKGDIALTKSLIKITLLFGYSEVYCKTIMSMFCESQSYCSVMGHFTLSCIKELSALMVENVGGKLSLFHIVVYEPEELKLVLFYLKQCYPMKFPVYWDIIKSRYKNYMRRVILFKVLERAQMVIVSETSNKKISVDHRCLSLVCKNLVNYDLYNFVKALFDEQTLNRKMKLFGIDLN